DGLPLYIDALVIVPAVFGSRDTVAHENDIAVIHIHHRSVMLRKRDKVFFELRGHRVSVDGELRRWARNNSRQGYILTVRLVRITRLQTEFFELVFHIRNGLFSAL